MEIADKWFAIVNPWPAAAGADRWPLISRLLRERHRAQYVFTERKYHAISWPSRPSTTVSARLS
ncbi:MAG: hypothetical protein ACLR76_02650 [Alistipes sp.]